YVGVKTTLLKAFAVLLIIFALSNCNRPPTHYDDISSQNSGAISGQVLNRNTWNGIPGAKLEMIVESSEQIIECKTDGDGYFELQKLPGGTYMLLEEGILNSCPKGLIITEFPESIKVIPGKILKNIRIVLAKGASISGYVFAADGVTPIKGAVLELDSWSDRFNRASTNKNGQYRLIGLKGGQTTIFVSKSGFPIKSKRIFVTPGNTYNVHFKLGGKGNASLKGKILSVESKQPVEGALLIFNSKSVDKKYTSGNLVSDMNGEYSIAGLTAPGECELSIFHWRHNDLETGYTIRLEVGENTRDFILQPRKESKKEVEKMKKRF
ncbi:MAG: hypothetical protein GY757_04920, partial [bacterium]|nr:hypothetical protein [bacterium]